LFIDNWGRHGFDRVEKNRVQVVIRNSRPKTRFQKLNCQ